MPVLALVAQGSADRTESGEGGRLAVLHVVGHRQGDQIRALGEQPPGGGAGVGAANAVVR
ncbi:hypothetical protein HEP84_56730 [Streptomyces sp. RLB1-33]|nr:hypothetical protein [Streptomyces sp. RLB1-33]